jgi:signal transduction histidine kinase
MRKHKHWPRHGPPWWDENGKWDWQDGAPLPPWVRHARRNHASHVSGGRLFFRFAFVFGLIAVLLFAIVAVLGAGAVLFIRGHPLRDLSPARLIVQLLVAAFVLSFALRRVGMLAARRFTSPLSETMKATDALAAGDLTARVAVEGSGEFRHFTRSFNRMAEALETADRQRRELLADVAHELRTPLTIIQGNLEGLRDRVYEATPEHLDLLLDETQKLARLVDDLRLLTLAEAGQLPLDLQVMDVAQLLADVKDAFAPQAAEADIALQVDISDSLPPILADPQRLAQVLGNLVTNALRYTPPGGQVTLRAAPDPEGGIRVQVADTGAGISPEDLPRIFDRFWRGDPARSREMGAGSGLGLAIARSLVQAHGGRIWAESQLNQGTVVSFILHDWDTTL